MRTQNRNNPSEVSSSCKNLQSCSTCELTDVGARQSCSNNQAGASLIILQLLTHSAQTTHSRFYVYRAATRASRPSSGPLRIYSSRVQDEPPPEERARRKRRKRQLIFIDPVTQVTQGDIQRQINNPQIETRSLLLPPPSSQQRRSAAELLNNPCNCESNPAVQPPYIFIY